MKKAAKKKDGEEEDAIDGPAVVREDHVQGRVLGAAAGAKTGWSRLTVYERSFRLGHLLCKERCTGAAATR